MTEQDIKIMITSILVGSENLDFDNQEMKYQGISLINPKTKKVYTIEEIISELSGLIDYKKINSINKEELNNITKLFLDLLMHISKLFLSYNQ